MARGKKYQEASKKVDRNKHYNLVDAIKLVQETAYSKFKGSVEMAINLGVDPRHADQNVRGAAALPHGLGKEKKIVVFAKGEKAVEASKLNVEFVGGDDLAQKISEGWLGFDHVVATPDMMAVVGKLGKVLGPRGLMPNPKLGTVTFDLVRTIQELKQGRAEFKVDKAGVAHTSVGLVVMDADKLAENVKSVIEALMKAKPASSKGTYIKKVSLSATMGPGVKVDRTAFSN